MTNKVSKKIIILGLEILAILAFGVILLPTIASAEYYGQNYVFGTPLGSGSNSGSYYYNPTPYQPPVYVAPTTTTPAPTPTIYSSGANPNASTAPKKTAAAKPATPAPKMAYIAVPLDSISNTLPAGATLVNPNDSNLTANALSATNSFMPNSIIEWVLFAILVLLIVILVRKLIGADKNYFATPLKHN